VVTSWVVVSLLFKYLFADRGLINFLLGTEVSWLSERWTAMVAICALGVWKGVGWSMMIFIAALQGVPGALVEAAKIDGAGPWQRFLSVTVPAIWPTVGFVTIMLVIGGLNVFVSVQAITDGAPGGSTDVVLTYMYRTTFSFLDFGYGSAIAVLLTLLVFALSAMQLRFFRNEAVA
jgi:multiple sugar transport system permease protein